MGVRAFSTILSISSVGNILFTEKMVGLKYQGGNNGIGNMNWFSESGLYAIRPGFLDEAAAKGCVLPERIKVGFSGGSSSRQLGVRLSNHASALVDMQILMIIRRAKAASERQAGGSCTFTSSGLRRARQ